MDLEQKKTNFIRRRARILAKCVPALPSNLSTALEAAVILRLLTNAPTAKQDLRVPTLLHFSSIVVMPSKQCASAGRTRFTLPLRCSVGHTVAWLHVLSGNRWQRGGKIAT